jgi:hypothetical protein
MDGGFDAHPLPRELTPYPDADKGLCESFEYEGNDRDLSNRHHLAEGWRIRISPSRSAFYQLEALQGDSCPVFWPSVSATPKLGAVYPILCFAGDQKRRLPSWGRCPGF